MPAILFHHAGPQIAAPRRFANADYLCAVTLNPCARGCGGGPCEMVKETDNG